MSSLVDRDSPAVAKSKYSIFERFAARATRLAGSPAAFMVAAGVVVAWASTGPAFRFSDTWQIVINTGTTIVTFLMVFLIQQSQNKDSEAVHLKLNELLASHRSASNRLVAIEELDQQDLDTLKAFYCRLAELARKDADVAETHSAGDATEVHAAKQQDRPAGEPSQAVPTMEEIAWQVARSGPASSRSDC